MIKFQNVTKTYKGSTVALRDCSVEIDKGEFVFLVGPSGSGKTTFIRLLLREEMPDSGRIWEAGKEIGHLAKWRIPYLRRNIGCVFQDFRLLPNKTVFENVAFALEVIGRPKHVIAAQVPQVLDLVGLTKKRDNLPHELSGGEQQRVAVARAFVNRPLILLADEPTGNLDPTTSLGHHEAARPDQPHRHHGDHRHPRRRHGGPDAAPGHRARPRACWCGTRPTASTASTAPPRRPVPARPPGRWRSRRRRGCGRRASPTASPPAPDARLRRLRLEGGRHQPVAQPPDDGGRHPHRGRVPGPGRLVPAAEAGRIQGHRAVAERGAGHRVGRSRRAGAQLDRIHRYRAEPVALHQELHVPHPGLRLQRGQDHPPGRRAGRHHPGRLPLVVPMRAERPVAGLGRSTSSSSASPAWPRSSTPASRSRPCRA